MQTSTPWKQKIIALCWRYIPAETSGITGAYLGFFIISFWHVGRVATAYASSIGESIGYYTVIITREFLQSHDAERDPAHSTLKYVFVKLFHILLEFGPAELLDSLFSRPLCMGIGIHYFGPAIGIVAGKLMSDVFFYTPVIISYELRKRFYQRMKQRRAASRDESQE